MGGEIPTFPVPLVTSVFLALLLPTWLIASRFKDTPTRFLIAAIWLRYLMSAFHQYTYSPVVGGLSLNAVASVLVTAVGFLVIDRKHLRLKALGGLYLGAIALMASALINGRAEAVVSVTKWGYLVVLTVCAYEALQRHGAPALLSALLIVFLPPLTLQGLSVLMGMGKGSEDDGSVCFIGGYNHEAAFSIMMLTFLYCGCLLEPDKPRLAIVCMLVALIALLLANYRTSLLAALPILGGTVFFGVLRRTPPAGRPFVTVMAACFAGTALIYASESALQQRFSDLSVVLSSSAGLFKPPERYTAAEAELLSARAVIWSRYITAYLNGSITNLAFGFGPDSWTRVFTLYAHNTFVSALYETGLFGLAAMVFLFAVSFRLALRTYPSRRPLVLSAHVGFLTLNLATMPFWLIEGMVLLALTLAYTLHVQAPRRVRMV